MKTEVDGGDIHVRGHELVADIAIAEDEHALAQRDQLLNLRRAHDHGRAGPGRGDDVPVHLDFRADVDALAGLVKQAGVSQADFNSCLKDQALLSQVYQTREDASKKFKVNSTPTFFVNGSELNGELPIEEFDKVLGPMLK